MVEYSTVKSREVRKDAVLVAIHLPLNEVSVNQLAVVVAIQGGKELHRRLKALGIRPGVTITKISGAEGRGPTIIRNGQTQTALGCGIARKILVDVES